MRTSSSPDLCVERLLGDALAREREVEALCRCSEPVMRGFEEASRFRTRAADLAAAHIQALCGRLAQLDATPMAQESRVDGPLLRRSASEALREIGEAVYAATLAHVSLMHTATRHLDSWVVAPSGTSGHISRQAMQEYQLLLGRLPVVLPETILAELDAAGEACRCACPACSSGVCMCGQPVAWREAHLAAHSVMQPQHIRLPTPRPGSSAEAAGLSAGDELMEVNGVAIETLAILLTGFKTTAPGCEVRIRAQRDGKNIDARLTRPVDAGSLPAIAQEASDCLQPSGPAFYLDRARDLQRQVRRGGKPIAPHPDGLQGLTARELQVLRLVADGATNPMIAERLRIARPTVARHVASILAKLGTANRAEAAGLASAQGFRFDR